MLALRWLHRKIPKRSYLYTPTEQTFLRGNCVKRLGKVNPYSTVLSKISTMPLINQKGFKFTDYDCLGFDLDNTVCRYKVGSMVKMEYETIAKYLVNNKKYPANHLMQPIEKNLDFMLKGLILDVENGNVLRISPSGYIIHGTHGTRELSEEQYLKYYGSERHWQVTDKFISDPLHTWNGPYSEQMRTLLDYFDMPASLIFARAVDTLDEINGAHLKSYSIWPDLLEAIQDMFQKEHFQLEKGGYFENMKAYPNEYIHSCSEELINWFKEMRSRNKLLFLITGSNIDFAAHTASNSMGPKWRELFDIVVCFAKKPGFFTSNRDFIKLDGIEEAGAIDEKDLQLGGIYSYGNFTGLYNFLRKHSGKDNPKIVYIGDNLVQDVYTPAVHTNCDTVAVCEELEAEGVFGHDAVHIDRPMLTSNTWGSYFYDKHKDKSTIWHDIIYKHSKTCVPSLEYVAKKPLEYEYVNILTQ